MKSGYIISKYLDEDVRLPKRVVPEYRYGIKCTDEEKSGPLVGYNRIKGYNYDYGGMRVVNRVKNNSTIARKMLDRVKDTPEDLRIEYWNRKFKDYRKSPNHLAGLALAIKYMDNKTWYIDKCMSLNIPKVNQSLAYVLKYLPYDDAYKYFEKLIQTKDDVTQIILLNEIPLLSKRKNNKIELKDDINTSLHEIIPERVYQYYTLAEKYSKPETIEHLASFVHLLPRDKIKGQYIKLTNIDNYALQDRLIWKINMLPKELKDFALVKLAKKVQDPKLQSRILSVAEHCPEDVQKHIQELISQNMDKI